MEKLKHAATMALGYAVIGVVGLAALLFGGLGPNGMI